MIFVYRDLEHHRKNVERKKPNARLFETTAIKKTLKLRSHNFMFAHVLCISYKHTEKTHKDTLHYSELDRQSRVNRIDLWRVRVSVQKRCKFELQ